MNEKLYKEIQEPIIIDKNDFKIEDRFLSFKIEDIISSKFKIEPIHIDINKLFNPEKIPAIKLESEFNISSLVDSIKLEPLFKDQLDCLKIEQSPKLESRVIDTITPNILTGFTPEEKSFDIKEPIDYQFTNLKPHEVNVNPEHYTIPKESLKYSYSGECRVVGDVIECG